MQMNWDKKVLKPLYGTTSLIGNNSNGIHPVYSDHIADASKYSIPVLDMGSSVDKLEIRKYSGGLKIEPLSLLDIMNGVQPKIKVIKDMLIGKGIDTIVFDEVLVFNRVLNEKELEMLSNPCMEIKVCEPEVDISIFFDDLEKPSNTEWNFKSSSDSDINWKDLRASVNYVEPLALVTRKYRDYAEVSRYVVVSKELMDKAHNVGMFEDTPSIIYTVSKRVFEIENNFSDWVYWAKAVKSSKWTDSVKSTIKVILPTV